MGFIYTCIGNKIFKALITVLYNIALDIKIDSFVYELTTCYQFDNITDNKIVSLQLILTDYSYN